MPADFRQSLALFFSASSTHLFSYGGEFSFFVMPNKKALHQTKHEAFYCAGLGPMLNLLSTKLFEKKVVDFLSML